MNRPFAYITAAWNGSEDEINESAVNYCRKLYELGYCPICPILTLPLYLRDEEPVEHRDSQEIAKEFLRRSKILVVCGKAVDEAVKTDIAIAERYRIPATTLDGILTVKGHGKNLRRPGGK